MGSSTRRLLFGLQALFWFSGLFIRAVGAQDCPIYREFNEERPNAKQYGAPDGCACVDGMSGVNCGFCESDDPCKAVNSSHVCRKGMVYSQEDSYKAYSCYLTDTLEKLFTNGKVDIFMNTTTRSAKMVIYNGASINDGHAIDCFLSGCTFKAGERSGECANVDCFCTDICADITKPIVEESLSQKPAKFVIDENKIDVQIEGSLFDIKAICNASACTPDDHVTLVETLGHRSIRWGSAASFSLSILIVIFAIFAVLAMAAGCFLSRPKPKTTTEQEEFALFGGGQNLTSTNVNDVLEFNHIMMSIDLPPSAAKIYGQKRKKILKNISGSVESCCVMGIMGQSGSGKSSLLNTLAAVDNRGATASGQILFNGKSLKKGYRKVVAYVQQADTLYHTLTVRECIEYSAYLRLSKQLSREEKEERIDQAVQELHLEKVANSRVQDISGGERRRVSIGMELVNEAKVIILDEPTSGLDSHASHSIMTILSELASKGRIIILSIHQPSVKSFMMMDKVTLLAEGRVMYDGSTSGAAHYFDDHGFSCPPNESISDFMLDVISEQTNHDILAGPESNHHDYRKMIQYMESAEDSTETAVQKQPTGNSPVERRSITNEFAVLFARAGKDILRNKTLFIMQLSLSIVLAIFAGGIFNNVTNDLSGFQNRMGAFYFTLSFFGFASFSSMDLFVKERRIFIREVGSKYYRTYSYFVAKVVLDVILLRVIPATVFSFLFYWFMSLKNAYESFIIFWATLVLFNICAGMISICISIATPTVGQANLLAAVWFLIMLLFGGFLVNVQTMAPWYSWLRYVSIFYYSFEILMTNELDGLLMSFNAPGYPAIPIYGEVFLKTIGMDVDSQNRDLAYLCILAAGFMVLAYLLLLLRAPRSAGTHFKQMMKTTIKLANEESYSSRVTSDSQPSIAHEQQP